LCAACLPASLIIHVPISELHLGRGVQHCYYVIKFVGDL
jgi:hypothetical protein